RTPAQAFAVRGNRHLLALDARHLNAAGDALLLLPIGAAASASDKAQLALLFDLPFDCQQTRDLIFLDHLLDGLSPTLPASIQPGKALAVSPSKGALVR